MHAESYRQLLLVDRATSETFHYKVELLENGQIRPETLDWLFEQYADRKIGFVNFAPSKDEDDYGQHVRYQIEGINHR